MIRIVVISDTHNRHLKAPSLPDGDVLLHAGDFSVKGSLAELAYFNDWLGSLPHPQKIVIAGNHDWCLQRTPVAARQLLTAATYLEDTGIWIAGLHIWGSPWQPWFHNWAFNLPRGGELAAVWRKIPDSCNVLITHGPPFGILDKVVHGESVGCEDLLSRIKGLKELKLHVFGHIHEGYGSVSAEGVSFVNASICNVRYEPCNSPVVIDLEV